MNDLAQSRPGNPVHSLQEAGAGAAPDAPFSPRRLRPALRSPQVCAAQRDFRRVGGTARDACGNRPTRRGAARRNRFAPLSRGCSSSGRRCSRPSFLVRHLSASRRYSASSMGMHIIPCHCRTSHILFGYKCQLCNNRRRYEMDANWFQQALDRVDASQADLARHLRLAPSAVSRMLKGERQMKLLEAVQVADFLGVRQEDVLHHAGAAADPPPRSQPPRRGRPPRQILSERPPRPILSERPPRPILSERPPRPIPAGVSTSARGDAIPIRSAARGGGDQAMFLGDGPIGYTPRPTNLAGVRDAYAIYMIGDSMEPRYEQGWLLHVNPFKPPTRGRDVVLYKTNDAVLIKQFVRWDGDVLLLRQLNPARRTHGAARRGSPSPPRRRRRPGGMTACALKKMAAWAPTPSTGSNRPRSKGCFCHYPSSALRCRPQTRAFREPTDMRTSFAIDDMTDPSDRRARNTVSRRYSSSCRP